MSVRMLKKLQKEADLLNELVLDEESEELTDNDELQGPDVVAARKSNLNPFNLLNQQGECLSESEFKEDDNETEHPSSAAKAPSAGQSNANTSATNKKKKKRKKKSKSNGNHISSEDNEQQDAKVNPLLGDVCDVAPNQAKQEKEGKHQQQGAKQKQPQKVEQEPIHQPPKNLLNVELKHLNAQNEMRRTFGKRVVKVQNRRGRQKVTLKTTHMVTPKDTWPPLTKNAVTMRLIPTQEQAGSSKSPGSVQWFTFEHSEYYQGIQSMFLAALERIDSEFLITLIKRCPYHVDALIQLSEVCKMTEDYALASELMERALYLLESSLHINFSLTSGLCCLDYNYQENRSFYVVLFKHAQYLEERACSRTAFEISKLLLSLQPNADPLAVILVIDYYALRSKQFAWLEEFYNEYNAIRNLSQLPNMAYSYALALYMLYGSCERSNEALQYALLMFPGILRPLLDEMSVQADKRVLASSYFFADGAGKQSPALNQLVCLYICRARVVWRQNDLLPWLESNVNVVLDRINNKDPLIKEYQNKRIHRYAGTPPRPILRHVILSDFKEKVPLAVFISKEKRAIMTYDPLPPEESINSYHRKPPTSTASSPATTTSTVSTFFQSLLPSFNLQHFQQERLHAEIEYAAAAVEGIEAAEAALEVVAAAGQPNAPNANAVAEAGLHQSLNQMMDAMREFLQHFRFEQFRTQDMASDEEDDEEEGSSDYVD
ncbi:uncharacterized protein Dwil_GK19956 [Drosophila willistoni]|uniref:Transcription factor 25 n=1 Tax=Drosophila willistoni TaxID=7260 RepID=B4MXD6_DROWI|nr:transcription factor 25 [Drosophila willistoni]EDW76705.1 uncharacterized protein Dwil_GK19956 [Drosophila willistoni]